MTGRHQGWFGLTGGIGSGKSTAAAFFRECGALVIDADEISRHAMDVGTSCYRKVLENFGDQVRNSDGTINRPVVADIVFHDPAMRTVLNEIIHPYVIDEMIERAEQAGEGQIVIFDIPLLFECGMDEKMQANIAVIADSDLRLERAMARDGSSREQVLSRMAVQLTDEELKLRCSYILENVGNREALGESVRMLYSVLQHAAEEALVKSPVELL